MKAFADLLDRLVLTPSRNGKLKLLTDYFRDTPDPDRGYGLAAIAGTLEVRNVKPAMLRELVLERMDEVLFRYSYDYVGDLAETISLVWDKESDIERPAGEQPKLGDVVRRMNALGRTEVRSFVHDRGPCQGAPAGKRLQTGQGFSHLGGGPLALRHQYLRRSQISLYGASSGSQGSRSHLQPHQPDAPAS